MTFWVYAIDWRSMAIEIIAECKSERAAKVAMQLHIDEMTDAERADMVEFKTVATTTVSAEMLAAVEQFKRVNGRAA